ncbi:unnamed protein product, partial [Mesorhabditis belari]|uniref:Seven TM Receptor n=1 Tax=Mesorhabditis belari TaxID=2138241 RepID=A0AAF3F070_9BILA
MGKYPWLLAVYSLFNVAYTTLDVVVAPTPYIFGRTYMLSSYTSHWIPKMKPIPTTLCALFLYIFVCGTWTLNSYVALNRDEEVFAKINDRYKNLTGRDVIGTGSITQAFEGVSLYVILRSYIGMLVYCLIMSVTSSFIVYCGWALKKSLQEEGKSTKTRNMQKELFKALIFQLLVPLATIYFPISIFFLAALLGVDGWDTEIITIMVMFDPIIEPIVIIYFITCYRRPIARLLCCGRHKVSGFWTQVRSL